MTNSLDKDQLLFARTVDDYLLYEGSLYTEKSVFELGSKYVVEINVPGFMPDTLELRAEDGNLFLRGFNITKQQRLFWTNVIKIPVFQRSLVLPLDVSPTTISARYLPGIVEVICPKQMIPLAHHRNHYLVQSRKIKIQTKGQKASLLAKFKSLFNRTRV